MVAVGGKIKHLRKNKGITQEQLADALSISYQAISKWETGVASPDIALLPAIANYFGINIDELFGYRLDSMSYRERFIKFMADNGVLKFGEFKLKSGRISPFYINTSNYKTGAQLSRLGEFYAQCIKDNGLKADAIYGPAYQGIPLSAAACVTLFNKYGIDMNYCFDRKEIQDNRDGGAVVGYQPTDGDKMLILDDTVTTGKALRESIAKLKTIAAVNVNCMIISVDRMEIGAISEFSAVQEISSEFGLSVYSIVTTNDIISAVENGVVAGMDYLDAMKQYRREYGVE